MGEEVQHFHRPVRLAGLDRITLAALIDHHVREFGNVPADIMVEAQLALLEQHHGGQRGDRLGHGVHAEDRVRADGLAAAEMCRAGIVFQRDLAAARDQRRHAGHLAGVDIVGLEILRNGRETVRIEANFVRVCRVVVEHL